jgi:biotin carboxyl carrier protein
MSGKRGSLTPAKVGRTPILASTFGSLALLHVESGSVVAEDDRICEIEAMKNFYSVEAPVSGTLQWTVRLGEVVSEGETLGWIE